MNISKKLGYTVTGVPVTFIGEKMIIGYDSDATTGKQIEDLVSKSAPSTGFELPELPFIGKIDASKVSLPLFTIILAGLDSFNPCAFFVLLFLLSMLIEAQSRKRMLLIGGTFVFFSGFIYFIFMAAWLNIFLFIGQLALITSLAGIVALAISFLNIKDFFFFGKGPTLSIPGHAKPKLFKRMRGLLQAESLIAMMAGTVFLAITANTYELLCTAGFPIVFTRLLTLNSLSQTQYYLYLVFYNLIYVLPLALIVSIFVATLGARRLSESEGRVLKLLSGTMMLCLGLVLLFKPSFLNDILAGIGLLIVSLALTGLIVLLTGRKS
jgi:hypothetical protein